MKKSLWMGLATLLICCGGCFTPPHESSLKAPPPPPQPRTIAPPPPVTADQVTAENRHQMAQALLEELDREANKAMVK